MRADHAGVAAVEFGLVAPILVTLLIIIVDIGIGFYQWTRVVAAVSAGAQFATLAAQSGTAIATVNTEVPAVVVAASGALLTTGNITTSVNGGNSANYSCCISGSGSATAYTCASTAPTCSDGSYPGVYLAISATHSLSPILTATALTNAMLTSTVVQRIK